LSLGLFSFPSSRFVVVILIPHLPRSSNIGGEVIDIKVAIYSFCMSGH
jgi:hypothetical protein